jgi:hypothetical protein
MDKSTRRIIHLFMPVGCTYVGYRISENISTVGHSLDTDVTWMRVNLLKNFRAFLTVMVF